MRLLDLLILPVAALWQQKLRTILTTLGVVFGAFVLAASLSIGQGVQEAMARISRSNDLARRIDVHANYSTTPAPADDAVEVSRDLSPARRDRLGRALAARRQFDNPAAQVEVTVTGARLAKLNAIPHVTGVVPSVHARGFALLADRSEAILLASSRPDDAALARRVVAGRPCNAPDERGLLVSEDLAYRLGLTSDAAIDALIGRPLRVEFRTMEQPSGLFVFLRKSAGQATRDEVAAIDHLRAELPGALDKVPLDADEVATLRRALASSTAPTPEVRGASYPVIGVVRPRTPEEAKAAIRNEATDADLYLPYLAAFDLVHPATPGQADGANSAVVTVDEDRHVKAVLEQALALGFRAWSPLEFVERERLMYLLIFGGMTCVAGVALLVAALGIANTMLMSVLERKREIGIMKALGADNGHLQFIFLFEGGLIGLVGAGLGLLLAWASSFPGDAWVRSMVLRDLKVDLQGSIFVFRTWIVVAVPAFGVLVTTLAAFYPARRASRVDPVLALRHD